MTRQSDMTAEVHQQSALNAIAPEAHPQEREQHQRQIDMLARLFSHIFHPMVLITLSFLVLGLFAVPQLWAGLGWALLSITLLVVPPTSFYLFRLRNGAYSDEDVSVRQERNELYFVTMLSVLAGIGLLLLVEAPLPFVALLASGLLLNISSWLINTSWKISVHSSSAALCATVALLYSPLLGLMLWGCALIVGWARIQTRNHTPLQVAGGLTLASVIVLVAFQTIAGVSLLNS